MIWTALSVSDYTFQCDTGKPSRLLIPVVEIFVDWLYTGTLPKEDSAWDDLSLKTDLAKVTEQTMVKVCALADRLLASSFSQAVEHKVISYFLSNEYEDAPPFYNTIILAFEILPHRSSILTLLVDLHCENYLEQHDSRNEGELPLRDQLPQEFLIRTMLRYSKILSSPPSRFLKACDYHGHGSYEEREACQDNEDARLRERVAAIRKRIDALRIR
jgi:hypothetical protein